MNINNFKKRYTRLLALLLVFAGALYTVSCNKDKAAGIPVIKKVTLLDSTKTDSSFTKAFPATLILITGENLGGIQHIYFNGSDAYFNPTYNTSTNLIISIPANAPTEATNANVPNLIRIVTNHGEGSYQFKLDIPPASITSILNENALPGDSMIVFGANFWLISKIDLPGGRNTTNFIVNKQGTRLAFILPDLGDDTGRVTIEAKYGNATSNAPINDHQSSHLISNLTNSGETGELPVFNWAWWGAKRTSDPSLFPGTRGGYLQSVFGGLGPKDGGWWANNRAGNFNEVTLVSDADLANSPENYALKFEFNTKTPWKAGVNLLRLGNNAAYRWTPWADNADKVFDTKNKWVTITVRLSDFKKPLTNNGTTTEGAGAGVSSMLDMFVAGGKLTFGYRFITEADPVDLFNAAFDNFRIIKIK